MKTEKEIRNRIRTLQLAIEDSIERVKGNGGSNQEYIANQGKRQLDWAKEIDALEWVLDITVQRQRLRA